MAWCDQCMKDLFGGGDEPTMMQQPMNHGPPPPGIQMQMQAGGQRMGMQPGPHPPPGMCGPQPWGGGMPGQIRPGGPGPGWPQSPPGMYGQHPWCAGGQAMGMHPGTHPSAGIHPAMQCGAGMPGVGISPGLQPCFKCRGNGFCHDSSMDHDKGPNERCFFCENCNACGGTGAIPGGGIPGMGILGADLGGVSPGLQPCFKCNGNGFCHDSSMDHDKGPNERCFFCQTCNACGGSGAIQGGVPCVGNAGMVATAGVALLGAALNVGAGWQAGM